MLLDQRRDWQNDAGGEGGADEQSEWHGVADPRIRMINIASHAQQGLLQGCVLQASSGQRCAARRTPPGPINPGYGALKRQKVPVIAPSK
jgi:hypothetical protein